MADRWSGESRGWRYLAQAIDGSGTPGAMLANELPLQGVAATDVLSGPLGLSGTISPAYRSLIGSDGEPILREYGTVIYAEEEGVIRGGGLLVSSSFNGGEWSLDCRGFTGYAAGMGYQGDASFVEADPLDLVRHIWNHIQTGPYSNLGLTVDSSTATPVRVGKEPPATAADGTTVADEAEVRESLDEEPFTLNTWDTDDLGDVIDSLAKDTPFDYHERHQWSADRSTIEHYLDFGYPRLGERRRDLRFVLGENVQTMPEATRDGSKYANHVRIRGAGEGSAMVIGESRFSDGRLRRMATLDYPEISDPGRARVRARDQLAARSTLLDVREVLVRNDPSAPLGSWNVGDELRIQASLHWTSFDLWFRVVSQTISPDDPEVVALTLVRADSVAA